MNLCNGKFKKNEDCNFTFCHLLFFLTGLDRLPPNGDMNKIKLKFDPHQMRSHTCGPLLELPVIDCHEAIEEKLVYTLMVGAGYGDV